MKDRVLSRKAWCSIGSQTLNHLRWYNSSESHAINPASLGVIFKLGVTRALTQSSLKPTLSEQFRIDYLTVQWKQLRAKRPFSVFYSMSGPIISFNLQLNFVLHLMKNIFEWGFSEMCYLKGLVSLKIICFLLQTINQKVKIISQEKSQKQIIC